MEGSEPITAPASTGRNAPEKLKRDVVVLVVDRFGTGQISAYGNTSFQTENMNRLCAESLTFEQAITPSANLEQAYEFMLTNRNWLQQATDSGVKTAMFTDDVALLDHPVFDLFEQVHSIEPKQREASVGAVDTIGESEMARFFAEATDWLSDSTASSASSIRWLHCRGLSGLWDAPYALREMLADEDDPKPPTFLEPPECRFNIDKDDPDELLGYQQALEAQVAMLDDFLGIVFDMIDQPQFANTLFCFLTPRGYPLGEHGVVGSPESPELELKQIFNGQCFSESVQVPVMFRFPNHGNLADAKMARCHSLVRTDQLLPVLADFVNGDENRLTDFLDKYAFSLPNLSSEFAVSRFQEEAAIQTHAWKLVLHLPSGATRLFAKPDDRWEVNDVSRRCPQVVEALEAFLRTQLEQQDLSIELTNEMCRR